MKIPLFWYFCISSFTQYCIIYEVNKCIYSIYFIQSYFVPCYYAHRSLSVNLLLLFSYSLAYLVEWGTHQFSEFSHFLKILPCNVHLFVEFENCWMPSEISVSIAITDAVNNYHYFEPFVSLSYHILLGSLFSHASFHFFLELYPYFCTS